MPEFSLEFFSPIQGQAKISLKGSGKNAIWEKPLTVAKGYNRWSYDLTLSEDELKAFKKATGQGLNPKDGSPIFLPKGIYTLTVLVGNESRDTALNIE